MPGDAGGRRRGISGGEVPALHRPLLPQRVQHRAPVKDEDGGADAQGDPCAGEQEGRPGEGQSRSGRAEGHEAQRGGEEGGGQH